MQPLPHTRPRPVHWIATATALAAVVAGAAVLQPADATANTAVSGENAQDHRSGTVVKAPDARAAEYPVECGQAKPEIVQHASGDLNGDGGPETVAVVRCRAGSGTPPSGIYVLARPDGKGGAPRVVATFLDPKERMSVSDFGLNAGKISATLLGYSSDQVPRCCPDRQRKVNWKWKDGKFVLTALPAPGSV